MLFLGSFFFSFVYLILLFFPKKLTCLLYLESLTILVLLFLSLVYYQVSSMASGLSLLMVCLMVLDSVFGLVLLVFSSRNSFSFSLIHSNF